MVDRVAEKDVAASGPARAGKIDDVGTGVARSSHDVLPGLSPDSTIVLRFIGF
jgi:hypothetical protein